MDFYFLFCSPQGTEKRDKVNKNSNFVLCFCTPTRNATCHSLWETKYKIQNLSLFFLVIFGATLSRRFARQIFTSFLSRKDLTKLKKQKNRFLFFVLVTTRYDKSRQSQQKLQLCILFLYSRKECTECVQYIVECHMFCISVKCRGGHRNQSRRLLTRTHS